MKKIIAGLASVLALSFLPQAQASTNGLLDGAFSYSGYVGQQFNGSYCVDPNICQVVPGYVNFPGPQNVTQGVAALESWLANNPDAGTVLGTSEGAQVIYQYGRDNPDSTQAFVVTGNPERKYDGVFYNMSAGVPTGGQITDVAIQYDFFADYPNNTASPYYWLAVWNVWSGGFWTHIFGYNTVNLGDPNNIVWTEGNITYVLVPNQPSLWVPQALIEDAYIRPTETTATAAITNTATTQEVSTSTVSTADTTSPVNSSASSTLISPTTESSSTQPSTTAGRKTAASTGRSDTTTTSSTRAVKKSTVSSTADKKSSTSTDTGKKSDAKKTIANKGGGNIHS
jgi:hypothetical protein